MFRGEDEDLLGDGANGGQGVGIGNQMINKENIMGEIFSRVATVQSDGVNMPGAGGEASGGVNMEAERSIKDIIDERQEQLRDLEQLQDMKQSQFVDALTNDIDGTGAGGSTVLEALTAKKGAAAAGSDDEGAA